jgi:hypothetical protein
VSTEEGETPGSERKDQIGSGRGGESPLFCYQKAAKRTDEENIGTQKAKVPISLVRPGRSRKHRKYSKLKGLSV